MFRSASNSLATRICVWLATGMLVFPFGPSWTCGCSNENPMQQSGCCEKAQPGEKSGFCRGCCSTTSPPTSCRSHEKSSACCCKHAASASDNSCSCGQTCQCHPLQHTEPPPATPARPTQNGKELNQFAPFIHVGGAVAFIEADSPAVADGSESIFGATALDRCITLSRFQC